MGVVAPDQRDTAKDCRRRRKLKPREFPGVSANHNRVAVGVIESGLPPSSPSRRHRSLEYSCTQTRRQRGSQRSSPRSRMMLHAVWPTLHNRGDRVEAD